MFHRTLFSFIHPTIPTQMPIYRTKMRCAYASPEPPKVKKPRAPRKKLTAEEAAAASEKREAKKKWKETLVNWTQDIEFKWPPGTLVSLFYCTRCPQSH